jgi:ABC-type polysaccharide/polyol phosphate transport system ATPase subunit
MSDEIILEVKNLSLAYAQRQYKSREIRDIFVRFFTAPLGLIQKNVDSYLVLENISFSVRKGEVIGILGVNGVGKTSICRYLAGIIDAEEVQSKAKNICSIFDTNISIHPDLTGRENATVLAELLYGKCTKKERELILEEAFAFSELKEFLDTPINIYSRGMKARLYLSLVTAQNADLVILDEIFGGTDIFFTEKFKHRIKNFMDNSGAVIMVSHNVDEIKHYCNRIIILSDKKIIYDGNLDLGIKKYLSLK